MMLCHLLQALDCTLVRGRADLAVEAVCCDSRAVTPGCVFVCLPGQHTDGRRFAPAAAAAGAAVLVYEDALPDPPPGPALVRVEPGKARRVLAQMAVRLCGFPARRMTMVGITGTKGKTTAAHLLAAMLTAAGRRVGCVGTNGAAWPGQRHDLGCTTPESCDLQRLLRAMADDGCDTCVMEVSVGAAIGRLTQMIREEGFQIIHCHGARANLTGAILRRKVRVPIVTTVHSDYRLDYLGRPLHRLTYGTINTIVLRMFDYHIGVSDAMAQLLISRGFDPQTMFAIYNGIDFTPVTPKLGREDYLRSGGLEVQDDTVVFGIAARLDPVKDMPTLIRGFSIAVKDHPNIRLLIAGEGEQRQMLEALAAQTCPPGTVVFAGWVTEMDSFYHALDVNTLTSISETFPSAITEGARMRCATIASNVGGIPYIIEHGVTGLLFEPQNAEALGACMTRLAESRAMREQLGENLYEKASHEFSIDATVGKQIEIYQTILRRTAQPKKKKSGVLICGAYGKGNAGDDAILKAILAQLKAIDRDMPIYVMSHDPAQTRLCYHVGSVHVFDPFAFWPLMRKAKLFVSGGGSLIQNETSTRSLN